MTEINKIVSISFLEPQLVKGKIITCIMTGRKSGTAEAAPEITDINRRKDCSGDHSISWFDVYVGAYKFVSVNERVVALVEYAND